MTKPASYPELVLEYEAYRQAVSDAAFFAARNRQRSNLEHKFCTRSEDETALRRALEQQANAECLLGYYIRHDYCVYRDWYEQVTNDNFADLMRSYPEMGSESGVPCLDSSNKELHPCITPVVDRGDNSACQRVSKRVGVQGAEPLSETLVDCDSAVLRSTLPEVQYALSTFYLLRMCTRNSEVLEQPTLATGDALIRLKMRNAAEKRIIRSATRAAY